MTHFHQICTTDPITGRDIPDLEGRPFVVEGSHYNDITIYFENEASRRVYLNIPLERVEGEGRLHCILDNPADDVNDNN
ncbi:MAG: hypothetical protein HC877_13745 [Thioploca sp.]|nr:hypothetical protein [Thioploca sp.]